ncbi:MAG: hydantoinase B/oxoprolinase family protein, partial [Candidatus Hydrogenedentes bacterium]|nr:hydantoinase B/oxoprolinase family protein [Candidatus Hydrogenedentota bacterium]
GKAMTVEEVAAGFVRIANENMAKPIKEISVAKGYDVQEYALVCFGGAAAQHACAIAETLGMKTILLHPFAGVLSAYGMGLADGIHTGVEAVLQELGRDPAAAFSQRFEALESKGAVALLEEGFTEDEIAHIRSVDLRYMGVDAYLNVVVKSGEDLRRAFESRHSALYGFVKAGHPIEVVNVRVESIGRSGKPDEPERPLVDAKVPDDLAIDHVTVYFDGADGRPLPTSTPVYRRLDLEPGHRLEGPAMVIEDVTTIVIDPGWKAEMNGRGHLLLRYVHAKKVSRLSTESDPVMLELFNNLFMSVAAQMGETLERVSHSVNIKERLDFSCAIFSENGELIANAPHIPVHLGAMSESVRAILTERGKDMQPGDVYLTNDPYHGGSHLPDLTVVSPVFDDEDRRVFFVANRGHHADIGGVAPGSMDPFSKSIDEEGVLIHDFCLVSKGQFHEDETVALLTRGPYPARNIEERLSDLRAQIAANAAGARLLGELCARYGVDVVKAYMGHVRQNAALAMQETLEAIPDGIYTAEEYLDSGARIACKITIEGSRAVVDFDGTDMQLDGNLNAPRAVVIAAVLYCFRVLVGRAIPLNGGCLDPIELRIPEGSLLSPAYPAAVVGGNVETSMRVVDVVFKALGALAGGQGTMNNLTFGTGDWAYYETICGGAGAGPDFDGASAVHTHMTNTRITDPEVLERRYPVVLREFSIRRGSGGGGRRHGGDGVVRALEFLEEMSLGILSGRRTTRPYGVDGHRRQTHQAAQTVQLDTGGSPLGEVLLRSGRDNHRIHFADSHLTVALEVVVHASAEVAPDTLDADHFLAEIHYLELPAIGAARLMHHAVIQCEVQVRLGGVEGQPATVGVYCAPSRLIRKVVDRNIPESVCGLVDLVRSKEETVPLHLIDDLLFQSEGRLGAVDVR